MKKTTEICSWKMVGRRFRVFWLRNPRVGATANTFDAADLMFAPKLAEATGIYPTHHRYEPLPPTILKTDKSLWLELAPLGDFKCSLLALSALYTKGGCSMCNSGVGQRNSNSVTVSSAGGDIIGFRFADSWKTYQWDFAYSQRFLEVMAELGCPSFVRKEVLLKSAAGSIKSDYCEIGYHNAIFPIDKGRRTCKKCGENVYVMQETRKNQANYVFEREKMPEESSAILLFSTGRRIQFLVSEETFEQIKRAKVSADVAYKQVFFV